MGPSVVLPTALRSARHSALLLLPLAAALLTPSAPAQTPSFDFGDGRHGSFTVPIGTTTIQDLWSQVRLGSDATAYDPSNDAQVPALENLTLSAGSVLTVSGFAGNPIGAVDPTEGGVLRLKVRGTLTIPAGATISAVGRGYRGGTLEGAEPGRIGQQGDSWGSGGGIGNEANRGGGGGGFGEVNDANNPGGGGGGGHREVGSRGTTGAGSDTSGFGGAAFDTVATSLGQAFRDTYPFPRFGSGGGRGGQVDNFVNVNALGGNGGGVIIIEAANIVNEGAILADGADGGSDLSGGGGGAGGSIWIQSLVAENGTVSVAGGTGGVGTVLGNDGGNGGAGILLWDARFTLTTETDGMGSVALSPAGGTYNLDTEVTLTATPEAGWAFDHWEGDLTGSTNPDSVFMATNRTVTAVFVELPSLAVTPTTAEIGPAGGEVTFNVAVSNNTSDVNWTTEVTAGSEFIGINTGASGINDGTLTVSVSESTVPESRSATLVVSSPDVGSDPVTLTITQSPAVPSLQVTPATNTASALGEELVVQVRNSGTGTFDWSAAVLAGTSFATISSGNTGTDNGTFVVSFAENTTVLQRTATISVTAPGVANSPVEIQIVQQAGVPLLQVTPSSQLRGSAAGNAAINVTNGGNGTLNWTAAVVEGGAFATIADGTSGTNSGLVTIAFTRNPGSESRTATIRVESGDASNSPIDVTITQTAQESVLSVTPESQSTGSAAGTVSFQVQNLGTGDMNWTSSVTSGANFITITDGITGTNTGAIVVSVSENTGTTERTGTIQIQAPGAANSPLEVTIVQSPRTPVLRVVPAEQTTGPAGGAVSITIENGGSGALNWTASFVTGADFLTFTAGSNGTGDSTLQLTVAANDTEEIRSGVVRIEAPGAEGSPQMATITQLGCKILSQPVNLSASDGTFSDSVELIWSATPGATEYEVFRSSGANPNSIELLGTTTEPRYSDTLAASPDYELVNRGCLNPGEFIITNVIYFYYVKAINSCGTSELSETTSGYRGLPAADAGTLVAKYAAQVLPNAPTADGSYLVSGEGTVALRLSDAAGVDPASLWVELSGEALNAEAAAWIPAAADDTDGWVRVNVADHVAFDTAFTMTVGGMTLDGVALDPVSATFYNGAVEKGLSEVSAIPHVLENADDGLFLEGLGAVHAIAPDTVYDAAQLVWIPVPEAVKAEDLTVYYYGEDGNQSAWYPADHVIGWLADPALEISEDGTAIGIWINHGGTVRLGLRPQTEASSAAIAPGDWGTVVALLLTGIILLSAGRRRKA